MYNEGISAHQSVLHNHNTYKEKWKKKNFIFISVIFCGLFRWKLYTNSWQPWNWLSLHITSPFFGTLHLTHFQKIKTDSLVLFANRKICNFLSQFVFFISSKFSLSARGFFSFHISWCVWIFPVQFWLGWDCFLVLWFLLEYAQGKISLFQKGAVYLLCMHAFFSQ